MKNIHGVVLPAALAGLVAFGLSGAASGAAKTAKKAQLETIKLVNLTAETPAKEIKKLNKALKKVKGVKKVTVTKKKGELKIKMVEPATLEAVRTAIATAGFKVAEPKKPVEADVDDGDLGETDAIEDADVDGAPPLDE